MVGGRRAETHDIVQRATARDAVALAELVGEFAQNIEVPLVRGLDGVHRNRAGDGVSSVQRALRAARDLHPLDVEQPIDDGRLVAVVDPVYVGGHGHVALQFAGIAVAHAPDHRARALPTVGLAELESRHELLQVVGAGQAEFFDQPLVEAGDRHRHVEDVLLAFLGRDDDDFDPTVVGLVVVRLGQRRRRQYRQAKRC